jgi:DNA-binding transcriptional MerR regulator
MSHSLTIREVATATGITPHTLRYYERIGLMCDVPRTASGHRRYGPEEMRWIEFLHRMRETGMSIRRMHEYARLFRAGDAAIPARRRLLEDHRRGLAARIAALAESLALIDTKIRAYAKHERERMLGGRRRVRLVDSPERRLHRAGRRPLARKRSLP